MLRASPSQKEYPCGVAKACDGRKARNCTEPPLRIPNLSHSPWHIVVRRRWQSRRLGQSFELLLIDCPNRNEFPIHAIAVDAVNGQSQGAKEEKSNCCHYVDGDYCPFHVNTRCSLTI